MTVTYNDPGTTYGEAQVTYNGVDSRTTTASASFTDDRVEIVPPRLIRRRKTYRVFRFARITPTITPVSRSRVERHCTATVQTCRVRSRHTDVSAGLTRTRTCQTDRTAALHLTACRTDRTVCYERITTEAAVTALALGVHGWTRTEKT